MIEYLIDRFRFGIWLNHQWLVLANGSNIYDDEWCWLMGLYVATYDVFHDGLTFQYHWIVLITNISHIHIYIFLYDECLSMTILDMFGMFISEICVMKKMDTIGGIIIDDWWLLQQTGHV